MVPQIANVEERNGPDTLERCSQSCRSVNRGDFPWDENDRRILGDEKGQMKILDFFSGPIITHRKSAKYDELWNWSYLSIILSACGAVVELQLTSSSRPTYLIFDAARPSEQHSWFSEETVRRHWQHNHSELDWKCNWTLSIQDAPAPVFLNQNLTFNNFFTPLHMKCSSHAPTPMLSTALHSFYLEMKYRRMRTSGFRSGNEHFFR